MWSGSDADCLRLYRTAALAIKRELPEVKVGGPALGASGSRINGVFVPTNFTDGYSHLQSASFRETGGRIQGGLHRHCDARIATIARGCLQTDT